MFHSEKNILGVVGGMVGKHVGHPEKLQLKVKSLSCVQLLWPHGTVAYQALPSMEFTRQEYWSGLPFPSPGKFPNPGIKPRSLALQAILYQLSHQESPRKLEWVGYPFSSTSSWPRNLTGIPCIAGRFFTSWANREAQIVPWACNKRASFRYLG